MRSSILGKLAAMWIFVTLVGCISPVTSEPPSMIGEKIHFLEVVTPNVEETCRAFESVYGVKFTAEPDPSLGNARTAAWRKNSLISVRAPMHEGERPVVRPYAQVKDIEAAVQRVTKAGGEIAVPPMQIPGHGTIAVYFIGGTEHGLWQR